MTHEPREAAPDLNWPDGEQVRTKARDRKAQELIENFVGAMRKNGRGYIPPTWLDWLQAKLSEVTFRDLVRMYTQRGRGAPQQNRDEFRLLLEEVTRLQRDDPELTDAEALRRIFRSSHPQGSNRAMRAWVTPRQKRLSQLKPEAAKRTKRARAGR
jgi:hypothetical protein